MAPMTEVIKGSSFQWKVKAQQAFKGVKHKLTQPPVLPFSCFEKSLRLSVMPLE